MFLFDTHPVSTFVGEAEPVHLSPDVWPVVVPKLILIPSVKSCSSPVIATPVAIGDAESWPHSKVSGDPVASIFT